jgi:CDGSH-type Zn-finger protein
MNGYWPAANLHLNLYEAFYMENSNNGHPIKIKIQKAGPYLVSGPIPLSEKIIVPKGNSYVYRNGRELPQAESYALCRCGHSRHAPFCDNSHERVHFQGHETATNDKYEERADFFSGPGVDLWDDQRCALARFCHREHGNVWVLARRSHIEENRKEAIQGSMECPTGRLVAMSKAGEVFEPVYEPAIDILQDQENDVSCGIFVKGMIPIESADGQIYEVRNRVVLCRCGKSRNKPYCDASHVTYNFSDKQVTEP